jgi:hypothetical protein
MTQTQTIMKLSVVFSLVSFVCLVNQASAQSDQSLSQQELYHIIAKLDSSLFATAYTCNPEKNSLFFTEDLEFYHDITGPTYSRKAFMEVVNKNFCGPRDFALRRELVPGTMKVYPMNNYGAVQTGEHYFYKSHKGGKEKRTGIAKFTHIWKYENGEWRISRVISYDHQPAE